MAPLRDGGIACRSSPHHHRAYSPFRKLLVVRCRIPQEPKPCRLHRAVQKMQPMPTSARWWAAPRIGRYQMKAICTLATSHCMCTSPALPLWAAPSGPDSDDAVQLELSDAGRGAVLHAVVYLIRSGARLPTAPKPFRYS
ncbi:hypothetical protein IQ07DRAFT_316284 [Pyrenochaeta sp. DS3sAY3a]|nr:hypothetical protein IQ07DRAFT_316284 [Pyrenochaeta sp. DS3sAY3a]